VDDLDRHVAAIRAAYASTFEELGDPPASAAPEAVARA
jgi:hypothetical protein